MNNTNYKDGTRYCGDIGMLVIDRSIKTCRWKTAYCRKNCYNNKFYRMYPSMAGKDEKLEELWRCLDSSLLHRILSTKKHLGNRIRICSRGEAFQNTADIEKIAEIAQHCPDVILWIPTRAWRNLEMKRSIESQLFRHKNLRIMASTDPTTKDSELKNLKKSNWSTMFFGDDSREYGFNCPKTWNHKKGSCSMCKKGCFSRNRVDVHLKQH